MPPFNQDDARERAMVGVLNLGQRPGRARHEEDGHLDVELEGQSHRLLFELKSTTENGDYGTGRDTGLRQLQRWAGMHFVFGTFTARDNLAQRLWYGSPLAMRPWNELERAYIAPDLKILDLVPSLVSETEMTAVLGDKAEYTYEDIRAVLKDQWNANAARGQANLYLELADVRKARRPTDCRYSRDVAVRAIRDRVRYLMDRGGTVNNRKIPARYVRDRCVELPQPWAVSLREAVNRALEDEPPS